MEVLTLVEPFVKNGGYCSNVIVIEQKNQGVSAARNAGLAVASGDYIMFVDSDDWCELDFVEKMVNAISECDMAYCSYFIDTDKDCKIVKNPFREGIYEKCDIYEPLFFGSKNKIGVSMSTSLVIGIFRRSIIAQNSIRFDTYIRFAEDWLFYAEYFKYVKTVMLVDDPLYHYYQRNNSVMHVFNPASMLGVKKSGYILKKFMDIARDTDISAEIYEPWMAKRFLNMTLNCSKNVWDKQNPMRISEKTDFIKAAINQSNIADVLEQFRYVKFSDFEKIMQFAIKHKLVFIISLYGIGYNWARDIRNKIRGY
jgi:glycosyltransferase involved in cell wall biosynthesis